MSVELHCAFVWDCDECGRENFERAIEGNIEEAALEADENQVVGHLVAVDSEALGDELFEAECLSQVIALAPRRVTCKHCNNSFETEIFEADEE